MPWNVNGGWGRLDADSLFTNRIHAGNKFLVMASTNANWDKYTSMLPLDPDGAGVVRVHATLQAAIDAATDSKDDVIYIADGHTETVTAAAGLDVDKIGLSIIGLGKGDRRPTINFTTATTADLDVDAEGVSFENLIFDLTGVDALAAPLDINADNCIFRNCEFITADSGGQAVTGILTASGVDGLVLDNCFARGTKNAGNVSFVRLIGGEKHLFVNSTFDGAYRIAAGAIEATSVASSFQVLNCNIRNKTALSTAAINVIANSTAIVVGCVLGVLSGTTPIQIEYGGAVFPSQGSILTGRNYYRNSTTPVAGTLL